MAVIEEKAEDGGTLYMDNIKLQVKENAKRRGNEIVHISEKKSKAVPRSVDLLLKKQEKLCRDLDQIDRKGQHKDQQFVSGANLPRYHHHQ